MIYRLRDWAKKKKAAIFALLSLEFLRLPLITKWKLFVLARKEKLVLVGDQVFASIFIPPFSSSYFPRYLKWADNFFKGNYTPRLLNICLTNRCCYNCDHCSNKNAALGSEVSIGEVKKTFDFFDKKGIYKITLTGGEPLLRADLEDILKALNQKGSVFIGLCTSGYNLSFERARELKKAGLSIVKISLDFIDEGANDRYKNFKGAFKHAVAAIQNSLKAGLGVVVQPVLRREMLESEKTFFNFIDFLEGLGAHEVQFLEPKPCGNYLFTDKIITAVDKKRFYELSGKANRSFRKIKCSSFFKHEDELGCMAGSGNFYLDAVGNLMPCAFAQVSFGNIREESLEKIYERFRDVFSRPRKTCLSFEVASQKKQGIEINPASLKNR